MSSQDASGLKFHEGDPDETAMAKFVLLFHTMPLLPCFLGSFRNDLLSCPLRLDQSVLGGSISHRPIHVTCSGSEILTAQPER